MRKMFPRTQRYWDIGQGGFGWKWEKSDGEQSRLEAQRLLKRLNLLKGPHSLLVPSGISGVGHCFAQGRPDAVDHGGREGRLHCWPQHGKISRVTQLIVSV